MPGDVTAGTSALAGTLTFAPGVLTQTVTLNVTNDNVYEVSEAFTVNLSNASVGSAIADAIGVGTITDDGTGPGGSDNDAPTLAISGPVSVNEAAGTLTYTVTLSNPAKDPVTVAYGTASGTATSGSDFAASTGTLTFAPGVTSQTFTVDITNDNEASLHGRKEGPARRRRRAWRREVGGKLFTTFSPFSNNSDVGAKRK